MPSLAGPSAMPNREVIIRRGKFVVAPGDGEQGPPASGAQITIFDSTATFNGVGKQINGIPFQRVIFNLYSSHDSGASGVLFESAFDGVLWRTQSASTFTNAAAPTSYDYLMRGDHLKLRYTNSANTLTAWDYVLIGILGDRNIGT